MKHVWYLSLLLVVVLLGTLHWSYGLSYVFRVYTKQESDVRDIDWKPVYTLNRSDNPRLLRKWPKSDQVRAGFELHPDVSDLDKFMVQMGSTSFIVLQRGAVVYEAHYNGHTPGQPVATFSVSKSVFSMMLGRTVTEKLPSFMNESITHYVPELADRDSRFTNITNSDLINMRSGIAFDSEVSFPFYNEDEPLIYYSHSIKKVILNHTEIDGNPGVFVYNDFNPNILGLALERASGRTLPELLQSEFWTAIGAANDAVWMTDYKGVPLMESGLGAAPVDLALIGQTMLEVGAGLSDFIPQEWHTISSSVPNEKPVKTYGEPVWHYKNGWWIMPRNSGAADYSAIGHLGQYIYISPQSELVIVRTGMHTGEWDDIDFIQFFYEAASNGL